MSWNHATSLKKGLAAYTERRIPRSRFLVVERRLLYQVPPDSPKKGSWSLADLCREMMKLDLAKPRDLRISNWEKVPLSVQQLNYAATDAYAGLRLWQVKGRGALRAPGESFQALNGNASVVKSGQRPEKQ